MMGRGQLIAIEGIDGAGTTTQAELLCAWLGEGGTPTHRTCEPSAGPLGRLIRQALRSELALEREALALLFAADRLDHVAREIAPHLEAGRWVITDRYVWSSLAYQSVESDPKWVAAINGWAPDPDLTIYIRVDPLVALGRVAARGSRPEIFETREQQIRIAARYDALLLPNPMQRNDITLPDPRLEILEDPQGAPWIREDPSGSVGILRTSAWLERTPLVSVVDGGLPVHQVTEAVKNACKKFASERGIWKGL